MAFRKLRLRLVPVKWAGDEALPELRDLVEMLQAHGANDNGLNVIEALSLGVAPYVTELAEDPAAWQRFYASYVAITDGCGTVSHDSCTHGSLLWLFLRGRRFTDAVYAAKRDLVNANPEKDREA